MPDLAQRLRDAVESVPPIELEEAQAPRAVSGFRARGPARIVGVAAGLAALGLVVAAVAGAFSSGNTDKITVGGAAPSSSASASTTRDGVTVTIVLPRSTFAAGERIHGRIIFTNRSGHPFRNGNACSDENLNVTLVGHGVPNAVPSPGGCTHPYLLPRGSTVRYFTVATTETGSTMARHAVPPGHYRIEATLYPNHLPTPPPVPIVITQDTQSAAAQGHGLTSTLKIGEGELTMAPPGSDAVPVTTAAEALATVKASNQYDPFFSSLSTAGMKYALFTDPGYGPQPSAGNKFKPTYVSHPVWFIEYKNVSVPREHPSRSQTPTRSSASEGGSALADEYFIVDDSTSKLIMTVTDGVGGTTPTTVVAPPGKDPTSTSGASAG